MKPQLTDCAGCTDRHSEGTHAMHTKQHPCPKGGDPNCGHCFPLSTLESEIETLSAEVHTVYQQEAKRQGDVRHQDDYADLPENIKEFDRAIVRWHLAHRHSLIGEIEKELESLIHEDIHESLNWKMQTKYPVVHFEDINKLLSRLDNPSH